MNKNDFHAQREVAFIKSEEVAAYIVDKGICKVHLGLADVESILDVAVLDGRLEKRLMDGAYRARKVRARPTALAAVPCLHCPMQFECKTGHLISPEQCEYLKQYFELWFVYIIHYFVMLYCYFHSIGRKIIILHTIFYY